MKQKTEPLRATDHPAKTVRCKSCNLNQFANRARCRRCHKSFFPPSIPSGEEIIQPLVIFRAHSIRPPGITMQVAFGMTVRLLRISQDMSQRQLAERCSTTRSYISKVENFKLMPMATTVIRMALALEVTPYAILRITEEIKAGDHE